MADADISITGGKELAAKLKALPDKIAINVMVGATFAGAKEILKLARAKVPILDLTKYGGPHEPGNLLANIKASRTRSRDRNTVGAKVGITVDAFYGHFVEFGTVHARAYPFMRPAADEGKEVAVRTLVDYASGRIEKEAKG